MVMVMVVGVAAFHKVGQLANAIKVTQVLKRSECRSVEATVEVMQPLFGLFHFWFLGKWLWHRLSTFSRLFPLVFVAGSSAKINLHLKFNLMRCVHKRSSPAPWSSSILDSPGEN